LITLYIGAYRTNERRQRKGNVMQYTKSHFTPSKAIDKILETVLREDLAAIEINLSEDMCIMKELSKVALHTPSLH